MFAKILIPSDLFGPVSAFPRCLRGAAAVGVEEAHLIQPIPGEAIGHTPALLRGLARPALDEQKTQLEGLGLRVTVHMPQGEPVSAILALAQQKRVDLIVASSFSAGLFTEALVHPLADALLHQSRLPLLGLGCGQDAPGCRPLDQVLGGRILFATDFSECSRHAFDLLAKIVARTNAEVLLLHVQERRRISPHLEDRLEEFNRTDRRRLAALADELRGAGSRGVTCDVELGHAGPLIAGTARRIFASLVLLGTRGRGWAEELFLGSVAHHVARHAPAPVLLVPGRGDE